MKNPNRLPALLALTLACAGMLGTMHRAAMRSVDARVQLRVTEALERLGITPEFPFEEEADHNAVAGPMD